MQKTTCELKNMWHSRIFRMKSRLFGFQMKNSFECLIHGSEFVCFLQSAHIYYWVWGKCLKVTKNFVYPGQQRRFFRIFWLQWLAIYASLLQLITELHQWVSLWQRVSETFTFLNRKFISIQRPSALLSFKQITLALEKFSIQELIEWANLLATRAWDSAGASRALAQQLFLN